jgi:hypothetical protein
MITTKRGNRWVVTPFGLHSGLRQNGGRYGAGLDVWAEDGDEKVGAAKEGVPQRLKPQDGTDTYGTAEAVPLSETRILQHPLSPAYLRNNGNNESKNKQQQRRNAGVSPLRTGR